MAKLTTLFLISIFWSVSQAELFSSLALMEQLLETQEQIIVNFQHYENFITNQKQKDIVDIFLFRCFKEHTRVQKEGALQYLGNPISAFMLITRLSRDLSFVERILQNTTLKTGYTRDKTLVYPDHDDLAGAVEGMARLQVLYDLDVRLLANGTLTNTFSKRKKTFTEYVTPMTASDCFELAQVQYSKDDHSRNIAWSMEALRKYRTEINICELTDISIIDRISGDYYFMGYYEDTIYWIEERISRAPQDPINEHLITAILYLKKTMSNSLRQHNNGNKTPWRKNIIKKEIDNTTYPGLCIKETNENVKNASLSCYYSYGPHPFLRLARLKSERLYNAPDIILFYDVITDDEIQALQALGRPKFSRGASTSESGDVQHNDYCINQVAWLRDNTSEVTARLSRRISQFSGLTVNSDTAEDLQIVNYGIGGNYGPHYDFIQPKHSEIPGGRRLATTLFYMTDVKHGGATIFTKLGLTIYPVKYAALFWTNLDGWGRNDFRTQHAACPVLRGSRWVASKWISLVGQELNKPCPARRKFTKTEILL